MNDIYSIEENMSVTKEQKYVIDSVLSIFETGRIPSKESYQTCTILSDGAGISYGKHQATDRAGSLDKIVQLYVDKRGALSSELQPYMQRLAQNETAKVDPKKPPMWAQKLIEILKRAGAEPLMQECQDEVFDSGYWIPAMGHFQNIGLKTALGALVVYDTCIHSGPGGVANIRVLFPEAAPSRGGDEKKWVAAYIEARRGWLSRNRNPLVQKTVYRMDALKDIVESKNWDLAIPLKVRGVTIPKP
jgi:chitosanase